ncbi:MAG: hypothetical protein IPO81_09715 [Kouleothrix sp.]|nr:hypothetical protein [Kouleothrix sp.]
MHIQRRGESFVICHQAGGIVSYRTRVVRGLLCMHCAHSYGYASAIALLVAHNAGWEQEAV